VASHRALVAQLRENIGNLYPVYESPLLRVDCKEAPARGAGLDGAKELLENNLTLPCGKCYFCAVGIFSVKFRNEILKKEARIP
jgi:hypothetical protein